VAAGPDVAAIVASVDEAGRILVVKQTSGPFAGAWVLPGGTVERNERLDDGARREVAEETGYRIADLRPVALYEVRSVPAGAYHIVLVMYRGGTVEGAPRAEPGSAVRWADPRELELHPSMALQLADLGLIERDPTALFGDLARIGVEMRRLF
jgi:8-oxo-dGTP diphosphatase